LVGHAAPEVHVTERHSGSWDLGRRQAVSSVSCPIPIGPGQPLAPSPLSQVFFGITPTFSWRKWGSPQNP